MFNVIVIIAVIVPTYLPGTRYAASTRLQTCCRYDTDRYRKTESRELQQLLLLFIISIIIILHTTSIV